MVQHSVIPNYSLADSSLFIVTRRALATFALKPMVWFYQYQRDSDCQITGICSVIGMR
jgi:hypothetical protein